MSMMLALLLLTTIHAPDVLRERFDEIEVNHFFEAETGRIVFSQWIFRNFQHDGALQIDAWRMAKGISQPTEHFCFPDGTSVNIPHGELPRSEATPRFDHQRGVWQLWLKDGDVLRCIEARTLSETGLFYDPEAAEREAWPREMRRELRQGVRP